LALLIAVLVICLGGGGHIGLADAAALGGMPAPTEEEACKAPLALGLASGTSNQGEICAESGSSKPPTPDGSGEETACSYLRDSATATITITFTPVRK